MARVRELDSDSGGYVSPDPGEEGGEGEEASSPIAEFYRGRSVFMTGVTGFVGKVLLEKLLRACSGVRTVYVLLRAKDGRESRQRLDELLGCEVFARLRREQPTTLTKVVPIGGDLCLPNLGLGQSDTTMLLKHVSVVFHSAATVRFDESLRKSVELNLIGTQRVLHLCQKMPKISALIHVSTAYSYCNRSQVDEVVYAERVSPQKVIEMTQWMDEELVQCILPKLLDGRPTTYHYSKALAENLLASEGAGLPVAIVRPSIVTAAFKEPAPGWVDGLNGPTNFIIATGKGLLRTMMVYKGIAVDWVPVDLVANLLITAAWSAGIQRPSGGVKVYNITSCNLNRITWSDIERTTYPLLVRHPFSQVLRYPGGSFKSSPLLNALAIKLQHSWPARGLDLLARCCGRKTEFVSMVQRMERAAGFLQYFTTREWNFTCRNLIHLRSLQTPRDREIFDFDISPIEWTPYLENYVLGVRKFILKEDESTLPAARRKLKRLYYAELLAKWAFVCGVLHVLLTRTNLSQRLMWTLIGLALRAMQYVPKSWWRYLNV